MYPVSQDFLDKIKAPERRIYGRAVIDYTDPYLDQSIQVTANEEANVSYPQQTADGLAEPYAKYAALDGAWVLGEDWALAPGPDEIVWAQMGWWGSQLAGTGGAFVEPYPTLTVTHFSRPVHSLKVSGDSKRQEWPVDFSIKLYGEGDVLLHTETVAGNTEVHWSKPLSPFVTGVVKQELVITKWSHEGRQVKILEFFTSVQQTYEVGDLVEISLLEEREIGMGTIPVGAISANEISVKLRNDDRRFDADNANSPLYQLLKPNRRVRPWLALEAENNYSENPPTFSRNSVAYKSDGTQVAANVPRFEPGKFGQAVMVEEGTTNLVTNPSFESGNTGWHLDCGGAIENQPGWHGNWRGRIVKDGTEAGHGRIYQGGIAVTPGRPYTLSCYAKALSGATRFLLIIQWRDASNVVISQEITYNVPISDWRRYYVTGTAPSNAASAIVYIYVDKSAAVDYLFDAVQFEQKPYATSFIDGTRSAETLTIPL
jgi:hypothetical protein